MAISRFAMEVATACATGVAGIIVCIGALAHSIAWGSTGPAAGFFPFAIGCLIIVGSIGTLVQAFRSRSKDTEPFIESEKLKDVLVFSAAVLGFVGLLVVLGLYVSIAIYLTLITWWKAKLRPAKALALGAGVTAFFFAAFEYAFQLPLPKGPLLEMFGIY